MNTSILYVGMDVHAQTISIALAEAGGEVRNYGSIANDLKSLERTLLKIKKSHPGAELRVMLPGKRGHENRKPVSVQSLAEGEFKVQRGHVIK